MMSSVYRQRLNKNMCVIDTPARIPFQILSCSLSDAYTETALAQVRTCSERVCVSFYRPVCGKIDRIALFLQNDTTRRGERQLDHNTFQYNGNFCSDDL